MSKYLSDDEIQEIITAAIAVDITDAASRTILFAQVNSLYFAALTVVPNPSKQLLLDLDSMNKIERLADGTAPLAQWLRRASAQAAGRVEQAVFQRFVAKVEQKLAELPPLPDPAGTAVAGLVAPQFERGRPRQNAQGLPSIFLGTTFRHLSAAEREALVKVVSEGYTYPAFENMFFGTIGVSLDWITYGEGLETAFRKVLTRAEHGEWTGTLIRGLHHHNDRNLAIKKFHDSYFKSRPDGAASGLPSVNVVVGAVNDEHGQLERGALEAPRADEAVTAEAEQDAPDQPQRGATVSNHEWSDAYRVAGLRLFLGRNALRKELKKVKEPSGPAVLVVTGDPATGKSYSRYLIEYLAYTHLAAAGAKVHVVDFETRLDRGLEAIARNLMQQLGGDTKKMPEQDKPADITTEMRWAEPLAYWIANEIERQKTPRWIVFDHIAKKGVAVPEPTKNFVVVLATIANEFMQNMMRVVLLDYDGTLPDSVSNAVTPEVAAVFELDDMITVYKREAQALGVPINGEIEVAMIDAVRRIWDEAPAHAGGEEDAEAKEKKRMRYVVQEFDKLLAQIAPGGQS